MQRDLHDVKKKSAKVIELRNCETLNDVKKCRNINKNK